MAKYQNFGEENRTYENQGEEENFHVGNSELADTTRATQLLNISLLNRFVAWYFFLAGQWFAPVSHFVESNNLPRKVSRLAYAVWQAIVVAVMWTYFTYSMGFLGPLRTLKDIDWLCPLTDIKNMAYGLCWIVNQHTGLVFFLMGNFKKLLMQFTITKEDVRTRASSSSIVLFMAASVIFLFILPLYLHVAQMLMPEFMPVHTYRDGKIVSVQNDTFTTTQVAIDVLFFTAHRALALPVFYAFLIMLLFLTCEVEKFKGELKNRHYPREDLARRQAIKLRNLIRDTEKAFRFFLALYIAMLLVATALEIFSIVEKIETVITTNHTVHFIPASTATSSLQTLGLNQESMKAFPHRLTGKHSFPYVFVLISSGNQSSPGTGGNGMSPLPHDKMVVDQYRLKTKEIVITAVLDITQNVVLYAFPLYKMSTLKSCLKSVVQVVEDSDYGDQDANRKIFDTRQDKEDFKAYFRDTCTSGIRVLGKEVSFLWTLVLTFFGPFAVVVVNLMFKHIHVDSPWH